MDLTDKNYLLQRSTSCHFRWVFKRGSQSVNAAQVLDWHFGVFHSYECNESLEVVWQSCVSTRRRRTATPPLMPTAAPPRLLLALSAPPTQKVLQQLSPFDMVPCSTAEPHTHTRTHTGCMIPHSRCSYWFAGCCRLLMSHVRLSLPVYGLRIMCGRHSPASSVITLQWGPLAGAVRS